MPRRTRRNRLQHPLVLVLVPALSAIAVAIITVAAQSDSSSKSSQTILQTPAPSVKRSPGVSFRLERDWEAYKEGWSVAFENRLPESSQYPVDRASGYVDKLKWASARGAIDIGESNLRLYLQNDGVDRVTVRNLSAKVVERLAPISQTFLRAPSAGANELIQLRFNLDSADTVSTSTPVSLRGSPTTSLEQYFAKNNVTLDPGETIDFQIKVAAQSCSCRYRFEVEVIKVDSTLTLEIGDTAGRPLAITGRASSYVDRWFDGGLACSKSGMFRADEKNSVDCASQSN